MEMYLKRLTLTNPRKHIKRAEIIVYKNKIELIVEFQNGTKNVVPVDSIRHGKKHLTTNYIHDGIVNEWSEKSNVNEPKKVIEPKPEFEKTVKENESITVKVVDSAKKRGNKIKEKLS